MSATENLPTVMVRLSEALAPPSWLASASTFCCSEPSAITWRMKTRGTRKYGASAPILYASPLGKPAMPTVLLRPKPWSISGSIHSSVDGDKRSPAYKVISLVSSVRPLASRLFWPWYGELKRACFCVTLVNWPCTAQSSGAAGAVDSSCARAALSRQADSRAPQLNDLYSLFILMDGAGGRHGSDCTGLRKPHSVPAYGDAGMTELAGARHSPSVAVIVKSIGRKVRNLRRRMRRQAAAPVARAAGRRRRHLWP